MFANVVVSPMFPLYCQLKDVFDFGRVFFNAFSCITLIQLMTITDEYAEHHRALDVSAFAVVSAAVVCPWLPAVVSLVALLVSEWRCATNLYKYEVRGDAVSGDAVSGDAVRGDAVRGDGVWLRTPVDECDDDPEDRGLCESNANVPTPETPV